MVYNNIIYKYIKNIDIFDKNIELYYKGRNKKNIYWKYFYNFLWNYLYFFFYI